MVERVPVTLERKPRVLFVGAFPPAGKAIFGGMVTSCRALLQSSFPARLDLDLIDSTQISNPPPGILVRSLFAVRKLLTFVWRFERRRPDAVLLFVAVGASVVEKGVMSWYARLRGRPALIFLRGGLLMKACADSRVMRFCTKAAIGGASRVLCQGPAWQQFAVDVLGFAMTESPIVPNWTASEAMLAIGDARTAAAASDPVRLLFVGWLDREKGILDLLSACRQLSLSRQFTLDLVGEGNGTPEAHDFVRENGLENLVRFHGWLHGAQLEQRYREADVFVLPSWAEGLPNAMIEAMAARLAVVVSAVGNIPDVIEDGVTGLLVPSQDVALLTQALARMIDEPTLRISLARAGQDRARAEFSVEPAVDRLISAIQDATASNRPIINKRKFK